MFMHTPIEGISRQTGIRLARSTFDRCSDDSAIDRASSSTAHAIRRQRSARRLLTKSQEVEETLDAEQAVGYDSIWDIQFLTVVLTGLHSCFFARTVDCSRSDETNERCSSECLNCLYEKWSLLASLNCTFEKDQCFSPILAAIVTVRALYAGTLVTCWTTASLYHKSRSSSSALLAAFCLLLATLTIAARCYASKNATHPLAQFSHQPYASSSIKDSRFHTHSSKLVLSKFFRVPFQRRDTRFKLRDSKNLLSVQRFNADRSKRELPNNQDLNNIQNDGLAEQPTTYEDVGASSKQDSKQTYVVNKKIPTDTSLTYSSIKQRFHFPISNLEAQTVKFLEDSDRHKKNRSNAVVVTGVDVGNSASAWNTSANSPRVSERQNDQSIEAVPESQERPPGGSGIQRSMPPALDPHSNSVSSESAVLVLVVSALVLTVALGLVTCVLSHYRVGGTAAAEAAAATAADPHPHDHDPAVHTPTTAPMLSVVSAGAAAGVGGMERLRGRGGAAARELAATRDRQVRLHAVHTDIAINLPPNIALPDGEDHPFTSPRLQIRDSEQESEIYQKCIKPPPNRTVLESESPPPYRSSSAGLLGSIGSSSSSSSSTSSDWSGPLVMRCHSMSSTSKRPETAGPSGQKTDFIQRTVKIFTGKKSQPPPAPTLPAVVVPTRLPRHQPPPSADHQNSSSTGRPKPSV